MNAKDELCAQIWEATATALLENLRSDEVTPGWIQCALRFLNDNEIQALPAENGMLSQIAGSLPFKTGT